MVEKTKTSKKKRFAIAVFSNTLLSGGAEWQSLLLAKNLQPYHDVALVVYHGEKVDIKYAQFIEKHEMEVVRLTGNHLSKAFKLYRTLKSRSIDIIFTYLLTTNLIGNLVGRLASVDYIIGGIRSAKLSKYKIPLQRFIHNRLSYRTIFNNYQGLKVLSNTGFNINKATVIANCIDNVPTPLIRDPKDIVNIITVGRFVPLKGFDIGIEAINILFKMGYKVGFTIVGYGELHKEILKQIEFLKLEKVVQVVLKPLDLERYYKNSDIYMCTSNFEGLSNTIMEAMSFSLPVVATDVGDNDRLVKHNKNGVIVPYPDPNLMVEALLPLLESSDLRLQYGKTSHEIIKNEYSEKIMTQRYLQYVESL